jgi:hypothetical protein
LIVKALTMPQVAAAATITLRHLQGLIAEGQGPVVTEVGRRRIVLEDDYNRWIRARRQVAPKSRRGRPPKDDCDAAPAA